MAKADLCANSTTGAWVTCAAAPALGLLGAIANNTIVGNTSGATAAPGALTSIPAALVPVYSGDCGNAIASSTLVCNQAAGNYNVVGTLSMGVLNPPTTTFAPAEIDFTGTGTGTSAPNVTWNNTSGGTNYRLWNCNVTADTTHGNFICGTQSVNAAGQSKWLNVTRGGTFPYDISDTSFGDATDNNTTHFVGTGLTTFGGGITVTGTTTLTTGLALSNLATQATNTVVANVTSGTAVPTATAVGTCSTAGSALKWTTNTGFGCNTAIDAATLGSATFANPGVIGTTPAIVHGTNVTSVPAAAATTDAGNVPFTLLQSGVPFIIDQCTLGATGGLTSCTSLPVTYGVSYMYFNASILAAASTGSTAGFYEVSMSSATAGQVCSPITLYSTGSPTVTGTCNTFTPNATGVQTPPTGQLTMPNVSMVGHSMGLNGKLECTATWAQLSSAGTKAHVIKWGANTTTNTPTTIAQSFLHLRVQNAGSESVQNYQLVASSPTASTMQDSAGAKTSLDTSTAQTVGFFDTLNTPSTDFSVLTPYSCAVSPN